MITPETIATILRNSPQDYKTMHNMNQHHSEIHGCKLGAVFHYDGEYHVYVGVNGRNRKFPCMAVRVSDRSPRKMGLAFFARVRVASKQEA